jgi:mRNA interferase MazF
VKRGDVVVCTLAGDYGKPRPAVVVQSDLFKSVQIREISLPVRCTQTGG